jgi:hypothetical protein
VLNIKSFIYETYKGKEMKNTLKIIVELSLIVLFIIMLTNAIVSLNTVIGLPIVFIGITAEFLVLVGFYAMVVEKPIIFNV